MAMVVLGCSHFEHCSITALHAARSSRLAVCHTWPPLTPVAPPREAATGPERPPPVRSLQRHLKVVDGKAISFLLPHFILHFASAIHHLRIMAPRRVGKAHQAVRQVAMQPVRQLCCAKSLHSHKRYNIKLTKRKILQKSCNKKLARDFSMGM
jgi:hypothetical protein